MLLIIGAVLVITGFAHMMAGVRVRVRVTQVNEWVICVLRLGVSIFATCG